MKKTLTAMALATSILPLSNTANAEQEANLNNLDNDNSKQVDLKEKTLITINKESLSATVLKDNVYLLNSEGKKVKTVEKGDKLQILKRISNEPFTKVNVNGEALYIANYAISNLNASNTSGTDFKLSASGKVINVANNDTLNVRDSDSTSGKILFTLKPNSSVTVSERTKNGWYKVDYYGNSGYVNGKYIQLIQPAVSESSFSAYGQALSNITVKDLPYSDGKSLFNIPLNAGLNIVSRVDNDWYKISYYGQTGYIKASSIKLLSSDNSSKPNFTVTPMGNVWAKIVTSSSIFGKKYPDNYSLDICKLANDTGVYVTGKTSNGWYEVKYYNDTVYVPIANVKMIETPITTIGLDMIGIVYNVASNDVLNIRETPDAEGKLITTLKNNTQVIVTGITSNDWYRLNINGKVGYANKKYIKQYIPTTTKYKVINSAINLRTSASWSGGAYQTVSVGTTLNVVEISNGWASIYKDGKILYAPANYLQSADSSTIVPTPPVTTPKPPVVEESKPSFTVSNLDMMGVVYNVASNDVLNIRETPDASSKLVTTLKNNAQVSVTGITSNDWYRLNVDGKVGYANKKYIKEYVPTTTKYKVINSAINLRKTPSWSGEAYQTVSVGTSLDVVEISNGWASVYKDKKIVYAPANYLQSADSSTVVPTPPVTTPKPPVIEESKPNFTVSNLDMIGIVYNVASNDVLNIRETPDASSKLVTTLKNNAQVNVTGITSNDWYRLNVDGKVGYANKKYIKEYVPTTTKYKVINSAINLRKTPSWSGEAYQTVSVGTSLDVVEISNGWASVYKDKKILYAPANYLQSADSSTVVPTPPVTTPTPPVVEESKPNFTVSNLDMIGIVYNVASNDVLNIRETPDASSKLVTALKNNTQVSVTGITSNDWYRVNVDGKVGYANKKYIKEYVPTTTKYKVINSAINLRKTPSWSGEAYQVASVGTVLDVVEINGEWASVYKDKNIVYAPASYLVENSESNTNTPVGNETYTKYNFTLSEYLSIQSTANPKYTTSDFEQYINPTKCNKFEFLKLDKFRNLDVTKLNTTLSSLNAGVLIGKGQAFLDTAKKYNIDPLYFIAQSIHETGYGKSTLAKGVTISEIANTNKPITDSNGNITGYEMIKLPSPVTVYNLYGIGAYDNLPTMPNRALILGTTYAYNKGWTSVEKAIDGAGAFVSSSYINSTKYDQNTLYKIRYNPSNTYIWHQYATTPWYSRDIAKFMEKYSNLYIDNDFSFDKPLFNGMSEYSLLTFSSRISSLANFYLPAKEDITLIK